MILIKTVLPVIILRGIVLLPNNEIRLEFEDDGNDVIDIATLFHDNHILIVSQVDPLEEAIDYDKLPKIGVIGMINNKMKLPNGKTRVILSGLKRAKIYEYLNTTKKGEILEAILEEMSIPSFDKREEETYRKKLLRELEIYIDSVPYSSNSIINMVKEVHSLDQMIDIITEYLPIDNRRLMQYLLEVDTYKRMKMILEDLYLEEDGFRIEREIDAKVQKTINERQREILLKEKLGEIKKELGDVSLKEEEIVELREKIEHLSISKKVKERLYKELKYYEALPSSSPEVGMLRTYIDWMIQLPWKKYTKDNGSLKKAKAILEDSHAGLTEVKTRILEFLAASQLRGNLKGPIICLVGPPGVGKTSLARSIAQAMNRKFVKISVGGVRDEAEILGHRRTYIGSRPGRIIQGIKKVKTANPVFLIDEIDKMAQDYRGNPADALLSVLDPEQNRYFSDNYIEEDFDLSKVMFVATANTLNDIPPALYDRLEVIEVSGYTTFEKRKILNDHLLPKAIKEYGLAKQEITITKEASEYLIEKYTLESGVRELERQINAVLRKLIMEMTLKEKKISNYELTKQDIRKYLGKEKYRSFATLKEDIGIVNGLSYTIYGGSILPIEVTFFKGNGQLILTGTLGDVIQESAKIAFGYIKANAALFQVKESFFSQNDIHVNIPEGGIPKDGPSAGVTLVTAILSMCLNKKVSNQIAMTGEITLRGNVLPVGGMKEKLVGASRRKIKKVYLPRKNEPDLEDVPKEVRKNMQIIFVDQYKEIYEDIFKR